MIVEFLISRKNEHVPFFFPFSVANYIVLVPTKLQYVIIPDVGPRKNISLQQLISNHISVDCSSLASSTVNGGAILG